MKVLVDASVTCLALVLCYLTTEKVLDELPNIPGNHGGLKLGILLVFAFVIWLNRHVIPEKSSNSNGRKKPA